jgi:hypothetical protein
VKKLKVSVPRCKTSSEIFAAFTALDFDIVSSYFIKRADEDDFVDIEPYLVCHLLDEEAFKRYIDDNEKPPIALRFLDVKNDKVFIIEWPSRPHETVIRRFEYRFLEASGNGDVFGQGGSFTAHHRGASHNKEADATFGPLQNTPNRSNPPPGIAMVDWVTLAVEVAVSQNWSSLEAAALWWASYSGNSVRYMHQA